MCDNYKQVTLLCKKYKVLANILYVILVPCAEEIITEYQGGLRRGKSTVDHMFAMRQIWEKCWERSIYVRHLFIDFQAANDTVWIKDLKE